MNETNQSNIGWLVSNGSGWNHHKTADALNTILVEDADSLPEIPAGYGVLVAPISDKPFGLRCALVRVLGRKLSPIIDLHESGGNYMAGDRVKAMHNGEPDEMQTAEQAAAYLATMGYTPNAERPTGWPDGNSWFRHADGTWASIEMCDDGAAGESDGWARDRFEMDVEIVKSCKAEQQSDDDSGYFIRVMAEAISKL